MLSQGLQRNAKPRKQHDFRHPNEGLYAAKHEAKLSNISVLYGAVGADNQGFFALLRMTACFAL